MYGPCSMLRTIVPGRCRSAESLLGKQLSLSVASRHKHDIDVWDTAFCGEILETSQSALIEHALAPVQSKCPVVEPGLY